MRQCWCLESIGYADQEAIVKGMALSNGICPQFTELDPYAMAWAAIDEAVRNAVAVGADPDRIAILDNFCWGNPALPDRLGSLVECARGCYDAAVAYGTPFISGKDSLNNEYADADGTRHAIPGTLLIRRGHCAGCKPHRDDGFETGRQFFVCSGRYAQ